jgi:hypothetical protein
MRPIYLFTENHNQKRKVMVDMAYLVTHKQIRLPKIYFEDGIYFLYKEGNAVEKFVLTKDKIFNEDDFHYYFKFKFKPAQVEETAI